MIALPHSNLRQNRDLMSHPRCASEHKSKCKHSLPHNPPPLLPLLPRTLRGRLPQTCPSRTHTLTLTSPPPLSRRQSRRHCRHTHRTPAYHLTLRCQPPTRPSKLARIPHKHLPLPIPEITMSPEKQIILRLRKNPYPVPPAHG